MHNNTLTQSILARIFELLLTKQPNFYDEIWLTQNTSQNYSLLWWHKTQNIKQLRGK